MNKKNMPCKECLSFAICINNFKEYYDKHDSLSALLTLANKCVLLRVWWNELKIKNRSEQMSKTYKYFKDSL